MERVLVCLLAKTRASDVTYESFARNVLDELGADLALVITVNHDYDTSNPYWTRAKYRWPAPDPQDYGPVLDEIQDRLCREANTTPQDWRTLLRFRGTWAGRIASPDPHPSASAILMFCRWFLLDNLRREGLLERYDRVIISRSDFYWACPHPPMRLLDPSFVWVPNDHHWGGVNDRHMIMSSSNAPRCLAGLEDIVMRPREVEVEMAAAGLFNDEKMLFLQLKRQNLAHLIREFPYVMYLVRSHTDHSLTWSHGSYEPEARHFLKYASEYTSAKAMSQLIRTGGDWGRARQTERGLVIEGSERHAGRSVWREIQKGALEVISRVSRFTWSRSAITSLFRRIVARLKPRRQREADEFSAESLARLARKIGW